jgi:hypothetical protein
MYLSGTEVRLPGPVTGDLVAAAGRIAIDHYVQGDAVLAAGSRALTVYGRHIMVLGRITGNVRIVAHTIKIMPEARIRPQRLFELPLRAGFSRE